jgi:hypothetical protein
MESPLNILTMQFDIKTRTHSIVSDQPAENVGLMRA